MTTCETTTAFATYGIEDGTDLINRTHYRLVDAGHGEFRPSQQFLDRLTDAFSLAVVESAGLPAVPVPVATAVQDGATATAHEFVDRPDADLRTTVLPSFYRSVADFYCVYRRVHPGDGVGIEFRSR